MATLRDNILPIINAGRKLVQDLGLRQHRIWVRLGDWSTGEVHLGTLANSSTEILPRPKVKQLGPNRIELSKITPTFTGGGWAPDDLLPAIEAGQDFYFVVRGPDGTDVPHALVEVDSTRNFTFTLVLERLPRASPHF